MGQTKLWKLNLISEVAQTNDWCYWWMTIIKPYKKGGVEMIYFDLWCSLKDINALQSNCLETLNITQTTKINSEDSKYFFPSQLQLIYHYSWVSSLAQMIDNRDPTLPMSYLISWKPRSLLLIEFILHHFDNWRNNPCWCANSELNLNIK